SYFKKHLNKGAQFPEFKNEIISITKKIYESTIAFWNETTRIEQWYREKQGIFRADYSDAIGSLGDLYFSNLREKLASARTFNELIENIPSFTDITNQLRQLTVNFDAFIEKFYYTFYLLYLPGMSGQKDRLLRDINFFLAKIVSEIDLNEVFDFLDMIFEMFQEFRNDHASPVLDCISTLGKKIIDLDDSDDKFRVNYFEKKLINFGFEFPGIVYVDEDWKTHVNENHLKNIRVWVEILKYASSIPEKLLSALIVNLRLGGVYISDTDLFQRDITNILNSNIAPFYKKVKQLSYIFPVYFNEIGAEGEIRQVTTSIDELSQRNDRLIHFLRKQVHIEGNNKLIDLTRKIFNFWYDGRLEALEQTFPQDVYESIDINGRWFVGIHQIVKAVCEKQDCRPEKFLDLEESELDKILGDISDKDETDKKRFKYICRLYRLLREKYSFDTVDIISILQKSNFLDNQEIDKFKTCLTNQSYSAALKMVFKFMGQLKEIILDPVQTEGWENIYYKRHVAFGIPSMYGVYREKKFEAMGLIFRLERLASRLIDEIIDKTNLHYISATTLRHIFKVLKLFQEGMELDGISNQEFNSNIQMFKHSLTSATFSLSQYTNIFEFMAESIREIISEYFIRSYEYPLNIIIPQLFFCDKDISEKEKNTTCLKKSEEFNRDMIANCFFLQRLDNFISSILNTLHNMVDNYGPEIINNIMSYNSHLIVSPFYKKTNLVDNKIFLGEKGYFLKKLFLAGVPVPQGFVITTEVFRRRNAIYKHPYLNEELDNIILKHVNELGEKSGRRYGDPQNPLLLSVRAGGAMSMPGAMDTFTNVGMNDEIAEQLSLSPGFAWASWDSYRRFLQNWGMAHDIHRDVFDKVISDFKQKYSLKFKSDLTPEQMRQVAIAYKKVLEDGNVQFEQDPMLQLKKTILVVFDSWSSKRARVYREHLRVSDEWGTAVIVQKMVYGNLNKRSGSGVLFTHNPKRGRPGVHLFGDFTLCSQGEDIVSGLVHAMPVGKTQRKQLKLSTISLQEAFPDIYKRIYDIAKDIIENHGFSHQEIEFTFESENPEDLYILQARNQNIKPDKYINVFNYPKEEMNFMGRGIGIGGGALNGVLVFDDEDLKYFPEKNPDTHAILARPDTVPDDIGMIFKCDGLITARGGVTSHAAVTATKIGKVCVVNCTDMIVNELKKELVIKGNILKAGDEIAIDGNLGYIYRGHYPIENTEIVYDRINKY
ncbi:MAG: pyruvate phosphate dikinase, partial [Deltaproteobacteria bacterium]|nr:pyruvate phosphate dikinase [Deltaproteobacteria bacterium]